MTWVLASFFAYMVLIVVVGFLAARRTKGTMESFYLGDRNVGAWVTAICSCMTFTDFSTGKYRRLMNSATLA